MPGEFTCDMTTELTDAEIGEIIRPVAVAVGLVMRIDVITVDAGCQLESRHEGACASCQASLVDAPGSAWLRWNGSERRIDWLADCLWPGCRLYRGHPGICRQREPEETASAR